MEKLSLSLTFDDVLLWPGYSDFGREQIDLSTQITRNVRLKMPLVSAPMDTVTESTLAIALAKVGGMGFIHRNMTIADQSAQVKAVKSHGFLIGAAVGSSSGYEARVDALVKAGVDIILIDSAHGYAKKVIEATAFVKGKYKVDVIAGNVATTGGAQALIDAGADALRVGMGPGAICSTRIVSGMGVPQFTALLDTAKAARKAGIPIIADGGIRYSGDVVKALAAGASTIMMGRMFAATQEAPGKTFQLRPNEVPERFKSIVDGSHDTYCFKEYRGMGSIAAMKRGIEISSEDEFHGKNFTGDVLIAEGVEGLVPCSGTVAELAGQLVGGVCSGFYYVGAKSIPEAWQKAEFRRITQASLSESHPHDLFITESGGNY